MRKDLPVRPSLEHLKSQAKDLLDAFQRKDHDAQKRVRESLPSAHGKDDAAIAAIPFALHDAQSVIAREYGFESFAALKEHIESAPTPELMRALMRSHPSGEMPREVMDALIAAGAEVRDAEDRTELPAALPLLPLRNSLLVVSAVAPLHISRASTLAAIDAAQKSEGLIAVLAQRDVATETPTESDLHAVGTAARVLFVHPSSETSAWIVVRATHWIRLVKLEPGASFTMAKVSPFSVHAESEREIGKFEKELRVRMRKMVSALPNAAHLLARLDRMSAGELADAAIANLPCSVDEKARYASEPSLSARLSHLLALTSRAA